MFIERKDMENEAQEIETQILQIQQANEERLNDLEPEKRQLYEQLKHDNGRYQAEITSMRNELENVNHMLGRADAQLREDNLRQRAHHLKKERVTLVKKKEELELQTNESNLPLPEARERLINRIKEDNAEVLQHEREIVDLKKLIETYERNIRELEQDLQESKTVNEQDDKYAVLHKKDKEMTEYMENFEQTRDEEQKQIDELEAAIPAILEHMSSQITRQTALPTKDAVKDKAGALDHNKQIVEGSEETLARIKVELETRQNDLEKIKNLETKIEKENVQMNEKLEKMTDEMENKFPNVSKMRQNIENDKVDMQTMKKLLVNVQPGLSK